MNFRDIGEQRAVTFPNNPFCTPGPGKFCPLFVLRQRPELHLFARDPRDVYYDLLSDPFDDPWATNLSAPTNAGINASPFELPADVVIPYGSNFVTDVWPNYVSVTAFGEQDFLRSQNGSTTSISLWNQPSSGGVPKPLKSVDLAAARVLVLPECSTGLDIQSTFFDQFQSFLASVVHCQTFAGIEFDPVLQIQATTYLTHVDSNDATWQAIDNDRNTPIYPWSGVAGGVMVNGNASFTTGGAAIDCLVEFTYDLRYAIDADGIFELVPIPVRFNAIGSGAGGVPCSTVQSTIHDAFENSVPRMVHDFAASAQALPPSTPTSPLADPSFECTYPMVQGESINDPDECGQAITVFSFGAAAQAGILGISPTPITAAVADPQNWTCRPPTSFELATDCSADPAQTQVKGRCQFHLKASAVIAEPDEVRLGWPPLDELTNTSVTEVNPSSAAFVLSTANGQDGYKALCTPPHDVSSSKPYYQRYFARFATTQTCTPEPPNPAPFVCPCKTDSQCLNHQACANLGVSIKQCDGLCISDSDCVGPVGGTHCKNDVCAP